MGKSKTNYIITIIPYFIGFLCKYFFTVVTGKSLSLFTNFSLMASKAFLVWIDLSTDIALDLLLILTSCTVPEKNPLHYFIQYQKGEKNPKALLFLTIFDNF